MWYENALIYQLYIRSFRNHSNEQATFKDLIQWIPHFKSLNIQAIWLNPFFEHGGKDGGYDIIDFFKISPEFGTIEDFTLFVNTCHQNEIKIITELVINHLSIYSELFRNHPEYFVWKSENEIKNMPLLRSEFVSSPFTKFESASESYYHFFYPEQADLDLEKPETKNLIREIITFWHNLGVDGFRLDAVSHYVEDFEKGEQTNSSKNFEFCKELVEMIHTITSNSITIAEINPHTSKEDMDKYADIFHLVMNFTDDYVGKKFIDFVNNHDKIRNNNLELFEKKLKTNSPFIIYYGDEIGLQNEENTLGLKYPEVRELYRPIMPNVFTEEQKQYLENFKKILCLKIRRFFA